jgi:hypothetical protein
MRKENQMSFLIMEISGMETGISVFDVKEESKHYF